MKFYEVNFYLWLGIYIFATVYAYTWDILIDWGLCRIWKGENKFLRNNLMYPKWFYYFAIMSNLILRLAWVLTLLPDSTFAGWFT